MADYEVLEPGGHARLVSDIKAYVNRADGVGTTQLADESVTMGKLGDDVTDELDGIVHDGDPLNGNVLFGTLAEDSVLTTDDAWAAPPESVEVFGKSEQASYTGKNLLDPNGITTGKYFNASGEIANWSGNAVSVSDYMPVSGSSVYLSNMNVNTTCHHVFYDDSNEVVSVVNITGNSQAVSIPNGATKLRISVLTANVGSSAQVELGSTATSYEPYTGGKPAPSPDYPQPIESVDDLTLNIVGKNLFDPSHLLDASGWTVSNGVYTGQISELYRVYGTKNHMYPIGGLSGTPQSYTMSLDYVATDETKYSYVCFVYTDGTEHRRPLGTTKHYSFISDNSKSLAGLYFSYGSGQTVSFSSIQLEAGSTETDYAPYVGQSVQVLDTPLRSLPDGTRDTLTLSYIGPSEHEGWGVYSAELVQRVGEIADLSMLNWSYNSSFNCYNASLTQAKVEFSALCSDYLYVGGYRNLAEKTCAYIYNTYLAIRDTDYEDAATFKASLSGVELIYALATPITTDLGTVELPVLPNPLTAWADGGSAQPTMSMEYERDVTIVIEQLEAQIEEILTS